MNPLLPLGSSTTPVATGVRTPLPAAALALPTLEEGASFLGTVLDSRSIAPQERAALQQHLEATLKQLALLVQQNKTTISPKPLLDQLQQLNNKSVYLSEVLLINANSASKNHSPTLLLSPSPLAPQQKLTLDVKQGQLIIRSLSNESISSDSTPLKHVNAKSLSGTFSTHTPPISPQAKTAIIDTLKQLIPKQDDNSEITKPLIDFQKALQQVPVSERKALLSENVQKALKTLANHIRGAEQLRQPAILADALKNSGVFFENKLQSAITPVHNPTSSFVKTAIDALLGSSHTPEKIAPPQFSKVVNQDIKGSLLQLISHIDTELQKELTQQLQHGTTLLNQQLNVKANPLDAWLSFFGKHQSKLANDVSPQQLRIRLLQALQQAAAGSLGKIQMLQLQSLIQNNEAASNGSSQQVLHTEIPIRMSNETVIANLSIHSNWIEEKSEDAHQTPEKIRQWTVLLGFELPQAGSFHAELGLTGKQLRLTLWADAVSTLETIKSTIALLTKPLENRGISISQLQCLSGKPAKPGLSINYTLVDIET